MYVHTAKAIERRISAVREKLRDSELEGILIGSSVNRYWLSGFNGSAGWVLITAEKATLATDFRYWEQARDQAPNYELFQIEGMRSEKPIISRIVHEFEGRQDCCMVSRFLPGSTRLRRAW